jgi:hypothetical protein
MPTTDEIRAAMEAADRPVEPHATNEDPEMWADLTEWEAARADLLAVCVRELYELVDNTEQLLMDAYSGGLDLDSWHGFYDDVQYAVDRYRAVLGGKEGSQSELR